MWPFNQNVKSPTLVTIPPEGAVAFKIGIGWGDSIKFNSYTQDSDTQRVTGWKNPKPKVGDVLTCKLDNGKVGVWIFQTLEYCGNPADMFFGTVYGIGYLDDPELGFKVPDYQINQPVWMRA